MIETSLQTHSSCQRRESLKSTLNSKGKQHSRESGHLVGSRRSRHLFCLCASACLCLSACLPAFAVCLSVSPIYLQLFIRLCLCVLHVPVSARDYLSGALPGRAGEGPRHDSEGHSPSLVPIVRFPRPQGEGLLQCVP